MEDSERLTPLQRDDVHRMLQGCINRICVSDDPLEIVRLISCANSYLSQLARDSLLRISANNARKA